MTTNPLAAIRERANDGYELWFDAFDNCCQVDQQVYTDIAALLAIVDALTARAEAAEAALEGAIGMLEAIANNAPDDHTPPVEQWKWKFWVAGRGAMVQAAALRKIAADALAAHADNGESAGNGGA